MKLLAVLSVFRPKFWALCSTACYESKYTEKMTINEQCEQAYELIFRSFEYEFLYSSAMACIWIWIINIKNGQGEGEGEKEEDKKREEEGRESWVEVDWSQNYKIAMSHTGLFFSRMNYPAKRLLEFFVFYFDYNRVSNDLTFR